jgi:tRNA(fMet)-specific endonuclease VapC
LNYLLDTNAATALIKGVPSSARSRFKRARLSKASIGIPTIVLHELWYGVILSRRQADNADNIRKLLSSGILVRPFDEEDAIRAGELRGALKSKGTPIGPYDVLIAAQALRTNSTLVTANTKEFAQVADLMIENWLEEG